MIAASVHVKPLQRPTAKLVDGVLNDRPYVRLSLLPYASGEHFDIYLNRLTPAEQIGYLADLIREAQTALDGLAALTYGGAA